jgi:hypothetical protein
VGGALASAREERAGRGRWSNGVACCTRRREPRLGEHQAAAESAGRDGS